MAAILSTAKELFENTSRSSLLFVGSGILCIGLVGWKVYHYEKHRRYMVGCARIHEIRDNEVAKLRQNLLNCDLKRLNSITELPLGELVEKLKSRELLAVDVLHAYQQAALEAHDKTNCLTTIITEAEDWSRALDEGDNHNGLLYGVPISIKDNIPTKGHMNSRGCLRLTDAVCTDDSLLVKVLKAEGAVPFVKTNLPQLVMGVETSNALYGRTCNPYDASRTCGGSSGGEAALIAASGSILGIGSDIGGSIRIPASHCGLCSLKPTSGRISLQGSIPNGQTIIRSCWGPMARDVDGLVLFMRAALSQSMFHGDKSIPPLPFDDSIFLSKELLTIGYYTSDGLNPATPPMARAVMESKQLLEANGHTLVPWCPPEIEFVLEGTSRTFTSHRGCVFRSYLGDEEADPSISRLIKIFVMPSWLRTILIWLAEKIGEPGLARTLAGYHGVSSVSDWFNWTTQAKLYVQRFEEDWRKHKLDAVICPSFYHPAPQLGYTLRTPYVHVSYASIYNFVDYAAGVVPVTRVSEQDITDLKQFVEAGPKPTAEYFAKDMIGALGLPVTVQCVTPMWKEELCLRLLKEVEDGVYHNKK